MVVFSYFLEMRNNNKMDCGIKYYTSPVHSFSLITEPSMKKFELGENIC